MSVSGSLRSLAAELLGALRTRVELFGLEWQQARAQIAVLVALLLAAVAFLWLAAMMFSIMLVTLAWSTPYRNWVVVGLLLGYSLAGVASLLVLKRRLESPELHPFAATVQELSRDADMLSRVLDAERGEGSHREDATRQGAQK